MSLWLTLLIFVGGSGCLAIESDCGSDDNDCQLQPLLLTYLAIEALSFRPPPCGTFAPAHYIEENDGLLSALAFAGPISLAGSLTYDAGFVNRPLHLIGCTPALVSGAVSVNAAPPVQITEAYTYNSIGLSTTRLLTTNADSFRVDVGYAPADFPASIQGDCAPGVAGRSLLLLEYDFFQRTTRFSENRPTNCIAANPNSRVVSSVAAYTGLARPVTSSDTDIVEVSTTATITTDIVSAASFTRDSAGRLTRRDQTDSFTVVISNPPMTNSQSRVFAFNYTYDGLGRVMQFSGNRGPTTNAVITYTYDDQSRVIGMASTGLQSAAAATSTDTFTYDAAGRVSLHISNFTVGPTNIITTFTFSY